MLGIDIYRYQTVTDWQAVRDARIRIAPNRDPEPIGWVYVKATDGGGLATVKADGQVRGAQGVGFPVGVYHFSQPGDSRAQARILLGEARRLNTSLPPMLDLEDNPPGSGKANIPLGQKAAWSRGFLAETADAGFRPCVYMNSADAKSLRPDLWGIPGLVVWIASYGPNNGSRNALTGGYPGRFDIHQYSSVGRVPGISGSVDMNESLTPLVEDTMSEADAWNGVANLIRSLARDDGKEIRKVLVDVIAEGAWNGVANMLKAVKDGNADDIKSILQGLQGVGVTSDQLRELAGLLDAGMAKGVCDEQDRRTAARATTNV